MGGLLFLIHIFILVKYSILICLNLVKSWPRSSQIRCKGPIILWILVKTWPYFHVARLFEDKVIHPTPFLLIVPCLHRIHKRRESPLDEFPQSRFLRLQIPLNVPAADLVILILLLQKRPNNQKLSKDYCKNRLPSPSAWLLCRHRWTYPLGITLPPISCWIGKTLHNCYSWMFGKAPNTPFL